MLSHTVYATSTRAMLIGAAGAFVTALTLSGAAFGAASQTAAVAPAAQLPAPPPNGEMGFVFSDFSPAIYPGFKENCPDGYANTVRENYLATVALKERERLSKPENEPELAKLWKQYGLANNTNVCSSYDKFPERGIQKTVQGKVAFGLNLDNDDGDGSKNADVCPHQNFIGATGEKGVDNQSYRALGCARNWRSPDGGPGDTSIGYQQNIRNGDHTHLLLLRGVDSLVNDDNVEVILASSRDVPIADAQRNLVPGASFHMTPNPRWRNVLEGRIVNGVLTTKSKDIVIRRMIATRGETEWIWYNAKLKLAFKPDGSIDGVLGGYEPLVAPIAYTISGGAGTVVVAGHDCAAQFNTIKKLADGHRDPKTGQCTAISGAYTVTAVPAFVFDRPPESTKSASAK